MQNVCVLVRKMFRLFECELFFATRVRGKEDNKVSHRNTLAISPI